MKKVMIHPERCVGCMQCMVACAVAHSRSKNLATAALETPRPRPRIHVGVGPFNSGFPNRCRHCNPAPCLMGCLPGAIFRVNEMETVLIDPDKCINCASCAMACPFGVIRFHADPFAPPGKQVAVKCDNCIDRQDQGLIPACAQACMVGAITFEEPDLALKRKTNEVSRSALQGPDNVEGTLPPTYSTLKQSKRSQIELFSRRLSREGANR